MTRLSFFSDRVEQFSQYASRGLITHLPSLGSQNRGRFIGSRFRVRLVALLCAAPMLLSPLTLHAAAPNPFGANTFFELVLWALAVLFGLVIFPICAVSAKLAKRKRIYAALSALSIVAALFPFAWAYLSSHTLSSDVRTASNDFAKYCAEDQRTSHPEPPAKNTVLSFRTESGSSKPRWISGPEKLARTLQGSSAFCGASSVTRIVAATRDGEASIYEVCNHASGLTSQLPEEYEILVRDSIASTQSTGEVFYKSSILITRQRDMHIVASGTFSFSAPGAIEVSSRCRKPSEDIPAWIASTFPRAS